MESNASPVRRWVGMVLKARREAKGWSLDKMADSAGLSRTEIYEVETGQHPPGLPALDRWCRALGTCDMEVVAECYRWERESRR